MDIASQPIFNSPKSPIVDLLMEKLKQYSWYLVSGLLLVLYLAYFHTLNVTPPEDIPFIGAGFATAWLAGCFMFQACFRNRFEFAIHTLLTADFYLESLVAYHSGYSFYWCAAGFWMVFWVYHHLPGWQPAVDESREQVPSF